MEYQIKRSNEEIDDLLNECAEGIETGDSKYPSMSYEEGIRDAIDWITGTTDENPME